MSDCKKSPVYIDQTTGLKIKLISINEEKRKLTVMDAVSKVKFDFEFSAGFSAMLYFQKYFKEEKGNE